MVRQTIYSKILMGNRSEDNQENSLENWLSGREIEISVWLRTTGNIVVEIISVGTPTSFFSR
jgi:hypothetical protein